tara:strand:+ start:1551 stop:1772 length:222 start_codon:yes stop_codon:yes gene_type:complete
MAQPTTNPYENDDTRVWSLERRVQKIETTIDSLDARLSRVEDSLRDLRSAVFNQALFFGLLIIVSNGVIGALL